MVICMALFTSCSKDEAASGNGGGTSTVGKKISEIYEAYEYTSEVSYDDQLTWHEVYHNSYPSELEESWYWDGDKIERIDYYWDDSVNSKDIFSYNNAGNVSKISHYYNGEISYYMTFFYNDSQINKFEIYEDGILYEAYELTYSGNKPIKAVCTYFNSKASDRKFSFMRNFPHFKNHSESLQKDNLPYVEITWTGNNITKIKEYLPEGETYTANYTYDNKNNPYYGGNTLFAEVLFNEAVYSLSQNNVKYYSTSDGYERAVQYNYYNEYPMQLSYDETYSYYDTYDEAWYRYTYNYRYNYLYITEE